MRQGLIAAVLSVFTLTALSVASGSVAREGQPPPSYEQIVGAALQRGNAYRFLQTLTDTIGPRLTGSEQSHAAADLLTSTLSAAGLENVHVEEYPLRSRWRRGTASARVVAPVTAPLLVQSFGWAPGTRGSLEATLVDAGVMTSASPVPNAWRRRSSSPTFPETNRAGLRHARPDGAGARRGRCARTARPIRQGRSPARHRLFRQLPGGGIADVVHCARRRRISSPSPGAGAGTPLPRRRQYARPDRRRRTQRGCRMARHVSADHVVLVGAHFDSWDTATGANDDGSGTAAVLETARILRSLGIRGRRTIRFVFFSGEEQAILGSHAYVDAHDAELDRLDAVLIMDEGAGSPRGFRLHGRTDLEASIRRILQPLQALDARGLSQDASFDQDHSYFFAAGVPALTLWVEPGEYETHHHAITDTIDKIDRRTLAIDTAVMALAAVALADADTIGTRLTPSERVELLRRTGLDKSLASLGKQ